MSRLKAQKRLHNAGKKRGNWRMKALLLATHDDDVSPADVAKAWPDPGHPSEYRFLSAHPDKDPEAEADTRWVAESGTKRHRQLSDHVANSNTGDGLPKHLADDPTKELGEGQLGVHADKAIPRMLFAAASPEEVDTLFREVLRETVIEGAEYNKVARDVSPVYNSPTKKGDMPVSSDDVFAPPTGQGGEIRNNREQYDTVPFNTEKYGIGAQITDEMEDQAQIDAMERQIRHIGAGVENTINLIWLREVVENAATTHTTASSDESAYVSLNQAWTNVDQNNFTPDAYVSAPLFRGRLFEDSRLSNANRAGSDEVLRDREYEPLLALETHAAMSLQTYTGGDQADRFPDTTESFGYSSTDDIGAVVFNSQMVQPILYAPNGEGIEIKDYDDPIRDLRGANARIHVDAKWGQQRAGSQVKLS
jgi:hypothetical protein